MQACTTHPGAQELIELWERGVAAPDAERGDQLLSQYNAAPPASLGVRNAALLALRSRLFGRLQPLRCNCPACGAIAEFTVDCDALAHELLPPADASGVHSFHAAGCHVEFRLPQPEDVRWAAGQDSEREAFVGALLKRCVTSYTLDSGATCDLATLSATVAAMLSERMTELEPGAVVNFDVTCPECAAYWSARMDCAAVLWCEVQTRVERLLLDVDVLARAYGWTEADVLALSPTRRAAYLQLVGAD